MLKERLGILYQKPNHLINRETKVNERFVQNHADVRLTFLRGNQQKG